MISPFLPIDPRNLQTDPIEAIGTRWTLITAQKSDKSINTMTASYGGTGVLWNKPVAFLFIRPQRYTDEFISENDFLTLSFFEESYRPALIYCGRHSGRDCDKIKEAGLHPMNFNEGVGFEEATTVLLLKKLYVSQICPDGFFEKDLPAAQYPEEDFHKVYVCEILSGYQRADLCKEPRKEQV